jgi:alkylation response protein AidB-like acyl-CoA dehydrogenase
MNLALNDEQEALVASFADLLAKHSSPDRVRAAEPAGFDPELWTALLEVGAVEMAVPEEHGGWGAQLLDLALVAERVGAAVAPAPMIEAQVAARLLAGLDTEAARAALAPALSGERLVTIAVRPAAGGAAALVPGAAVADEAVVLDGERLLLVPLRDGTRSAVANLAAAPLADVTLGGAEATELATGPAAVAAFEAALDDWLVLTAAALVGMGTSAHQLTCGYARDRRAWDQPIGAYQAVAHPLADGATALDGARLLVARSAVEAGRGGSRARELAAMAFAFAAETARKVTYDGIHFHGGNGFTLEFDAQLYYRRARGWSRVWGEPRQAYRRAARARHDRGREA